MENSDEYSISFVCDEKTESSFNWSFSSEKEHSPLSTSNIQHVKRQLYEEDVASAGPDIPSNQQTTNADDVEKTWPDNGEEETTEIQGCSQLDVSISLSDMDQTAEGGVFKLESTIANLSPSAGGKKRRGRPPLLVKKFNITGGDAAAVFQQGPFNEDDTKSTPDVKKKRGRPVKKSLALISAPVETQHLEIGDQQHQFQPTSTDEVSTSQSSSYSAFDSAGLKRKRGRLSLQIETPSKSSDAAADSDQSMSIVKRKRGRPSSTSSNSSSMRIQWSPCKSSSKESSLSDKKIIKPVHLITEEKPLDYISPTTEVAFAEKYQSCSPFKFRGRKPSSVRSNPDANEEPTSPNLTVDSTELLD